MKKILVVVLIISLAFTGLTACNAEEETMDLEGIIITLERTACYGFCPIYSLTIRGNGSVIYEGENFVEIVGTAETVISREKVEQLISEFDQVDYDSFKDSYTERTITDAPSVITSITKDGKTKTIEHYHGDFNAPEVLTELEDKIDEIVNSEQWIK